MRIAFFTHYALLYGANRSLLNLIDGLKHYGIEPFVISPAKGDLTEALCKRGVPVAVMPLKMWMATTRSWRSVAKCLYQNVQQLLPLARQLQAWNIDVVYTNSLAIPMGAMISKLLRCPHVWHLREFGDLDYGLQFDWGKRISHRVIETADAVITVSRAIKNHFFRQDNFDHVHIIYNGVASKAQFDLLYDKANNSSFSSSRYTFTIVGGVLPSKGQDIAIKALAQLSQKIPQVRLIIAGSGEETYVRSCRELASHLGVANQVEFWGYIDDPFKAFLAADATLVCSAYEAFGRVTVESMAACRPVIGLDRAGTSELIMHERNGLLYQGGPTALARCMERVATNPTWAQNLGKNGWREARARYSVEVYSQQVFDVLQSILAT